MTLYEVCLAFDDESIRILSHLTLKDSFELAERIPTIFTKE